MRKKTCDLKKPHSKRKPYYLAARYDEGIIVVKCRSRAHAESIAEDALADGMIVHPDDFAIGTCPDCVRRTVQDAIDRETANEALTLWEQALRIRHTMLPPIPEDLN